MPLSTVPRDLVFSLHHLYHGQILITVQQHNRKRFGMRSPLKCVRGPSVIQVTLKCVRRSSHTYALAPNWFRATQYKLEN